VVVRDREAADAIRAWHVSANPGPLLLLPIDAMSEEQAGEAEAGSLYPLVEAAAAARPWVRTLLGHVRAEDRGTAFVDARGAVWLPGASGGPGPLRRRAELFALREELTRSELARQDAFAAADAQRAALQRAEQRLAEATESADQAQLEVRRSTEHQAELDRRLQRAERELRDADALAARLSGRRDELAQRLALLDANAAAIADVVASQESLVASERIALSDVEHAQEAARERRTKCQVEEAQSQARLQMSSDRERRLVQELQSASSRLEALRAELSDLANADSALAEQMAHWQLDAESRDATLADGEARLRDAESALREADDALQYAEHALDEVRHRATETSEEVHRAEMRFADLSGRRRSIRERLEAEWRRPLDEMLAAVPPVAMDDETLRTESAALREQLEALGPVNVLAIEEHEETVKRLDFLTTQRADLAEARQSLQQAIREIDATARELFLATFTQVRENFRQIFLTLFGGGECDLRLENPETPLDCDIEIHASPRGKRTQRIHLLSSGERALVALSLLFGIFLTKPSPFCLLDEVDAPLDDANVGRFVRMLNQFKMRTQFIVITHNPRTTTEAADAVYGVTMQEPGVSTIVSVRMRGAVIDDLFGASTIGAVTAPA
jgi:chromosome segregation protein